MTLFNLGKKKEKKKTSEYSCNCKCITNETEKKQNDCCLNLKENKICYIKVLGTGCKSCHEQYENAKQAIKDMKLSVEVEYITDMQKIMKYGVMSMPSIVVNEKVISMGKVLKPADIIDLLNNLRFYA